MSVSTDPQKIEEILDRGVENVYPGRDYLKERLESGDKLKLYVGYDPTAPSLHIGHGISMLKMRQFQELGHEVVMLIGDFTAMIGDPTDKDTARNKLSRSEVLDNCKEYKQQASAILDFEGKNPAHLEYNSEWLGDMNFADVIDLSSNFTVQNMMERDMFQRRIDKEAPIYVHEFMYPMMQAYDCVAMDVDGEVGGNDQTFNMLKGRELMKKLKDKDKFVITTKILTTNDGKKMSKSEGNAITLSDSPADMYGKVMRWSDDAIANGYELATDVDIEEVREIKEELDEIDNPMPLKKRLAYEVTRTFLGEDAAQKGQDHFQKVIQEEEKPDQMEEVEPSSYDVLSVLVEAELVSSKSEGRRMIDQNAVSLNDEKVEDYFEEVEPGDIVQKGKRFFAKVK